MGLEGVELVIAMEEAFDISISDEEAESITTPEEAIALILKKVPVGNDDLCLNQRAFNQIRKILVSEFSVSRTEINTQSDISKLVEAERHKRLWVRLKEVTNIKSWPELSRPAWIIYIAWLVFLVSTVYAGIEIGFGLGLLIGLGLFTLIMFITKPLKKVVPSYYSKMERLVRFMVSANPNVFKSNNNWSNAQIKEQMKDIVMEVLGIDEYDEKWKFVDDFGIG